jgi:hypothetical protein
MQLAATRVQRAQRRRVGSRQRAATLLRRLRLRPRC